MELIGLILSIIAILFSLFSYLKHDKKIKEQSLIINNYNIEKIKSETEINKKAIIEANVIKTSNGTRIIKVYNKGKSIARNTVISIPDSDLLSIIKKNPSPIDIRPQNYVELMFYPTFYKYPDKMEIIFEWSDEYNNKNIDTQTIQL